MSHNIFSSRQVPQVRAAVFGANLGRPTLRLTSFRALCERVGESIIATRVGAALGLPLTGRVLSSGRE